MALVENIDPFKPLAAAEGAGLIGYQAPGSSVLRTVQGTLDIRTYAWTWGAVADGVTDDAPALNAAIQYLKGLGGGELILSRGIYGLKAPLSLLGAFVTITGAGIAGTQLKALTGFTGGMIIDLYESSDARISPATVRGMTLNANSVAPACLQIQYRHMLRFEDCLMTGATVAAVYSVNAWLNQYYNCNFEGSAKGVTLDGSNHRTAFYGCSFQGCTGALLTIRNSGAANDGNGSLLFSNCDFEFSSSHACDIQCTSATFHECYTGENIQGTVFIVYAGNVTVSGGQLFYGFTGNTNLITAIGGALIVRGSVINGQTYASIGSIAYGSGGKFRIEDTPTYVPTGGAVSFPGDALLFKAGLSFVTRLGIDWEGYGYNTTITQAAAAGSGKTVTATVVPGPSPVFGLRATLSSQQWVDGKPWAVVCTYSSNVDINVRVAAAALGAGTVIGTLPSTGGVVSTAVLYGTTANRTTATVMEVFRDSAVAVGHSFTMYDMSFGDARQVGADLGGSFSQLCKF